MQHLSITEEGLQLIISGLELIEGKEAEHLANVLSGMAMQGREQNDFPIHINVKETIYPTIKELHALANDHYSSDEIQIDQDAKISRGDSGSWVQGWLYVEHPEKD